MGLVDGLIFAVLGAFAGFFLGLIAAVVFMANGRDDDGETC